MRVLLAAWAVLSAAACNQEAVRAEIDPLTEHPFDQWAELATAKCSADVDDLLERDLVGSYKFRWVASSILRMPRWTRAQCAKTLEPTMFQVTNELLQKPDSDFYSDVPREYVDEFREYQIDRAIHQRAYLLAIMGDNKQAAEVLENSPNIMKTQTPGVAINLDEPLVAFLKSDRERLARTLPALRRAAIAESKYCASGGGLNCDVPEATIFFNPVYRQALILENCLGVMYLDLYDHECADIPSAQFSMVNPDAEP